MSSICLPTRQQLPQNPTSHLLRLPREIRDQIYTHLFTTTALQIRPVTTTESTKIKTHYLNTPFQHYTSSDPCNLLDAHASIAPRITTIFDTSILFVNHQIHEESLQVLYETKTVYLSLYYGCKEGSLLDSPRLPQILERARYLRISTYNISFLSPFLPLFTARTDVKMLEIGFRTVHALRCISGDFDKEKVAEYLRPFAEMKVRGPTKLSWTLFNSEVMNPSMQVLNPGSGVDMEVNFAGCFGRVRHCMLE